MYKRYKLIDYLPHIIVILYIKIIHKIFNKNIKLIKIYDKIIK